MIVFHELFKPQVVNFSRKENLNLDEWTLVGIATAWSTYELPLADVLHCHRSSVATIASYVEE